MIALLDTSEDLSVCEGELGCAVGQLLTPLTRFTLQKPELPFAIDNGAFAKFEEKAFLSLLKREEHRKSACRFVVAPDVVASARRTLEVFEFWKVQLMGWRVALAIQDGQQDLPIPWAAIDAVFIGGSTQFKLSPYAAHIIKAAQILGKWTHVGRVNDPSRFAMFEKLGVDSIDGSGISRFSHMRLAIAKRNNQENLFEEQV
jgi:hypothetical protein